MGMAAALEEACAINNAKTASGLLLDAQTGAITLPSEMLFAVGANTLSGQGEQYLDHFLPVYLSVLLSDEFSPYIAEIIIEGHTDSVGTYLSNRKILACGGSYMATAAQIKNRDFPGITAAAKQALDISLGFELAHIGINSGNEQNAINTAETISDIFRLSARYMNSAVFAGTAVEAVKAEGFGTRGHIGFFTNSIERAIAYFQTKGIELNPESIKRNASGEITCIYLKQEIGGFAFHVVER